MARFSFTLNGSPCDVDADTSTPLLYVLRDNLALNGPRYGCGQEQCGACKVVIDGRTAWSCTTPIDDVDGRDVMTVDGLAGGGDLHPLQQAFLEFNAAQCGYCTSGILMAAWALLQENPAPNRQQIQQALDGHLCRCGAHNRIIAAVGRAAEMTGPG